MARRRPPVLGLAFLDAMTCGLGAVILLYMIINASVAQRGDRLSSDLQAEVDRLEVEVLAGQARLVELRNALHGVDEGTATARGLSRRLIEALERIRVELADSEHSSLAQRESVERLQSDILRLEQETKRLAAETPPEDEAPGEKTRAFVGDGDRQYLTGLKIGGERIFILVDASASMLAKTVVNAVRRRHLPPARKLQSPKWRQAVRTVDWLSTQLPEGSAFQIYTFAEEARPVLADSAGRWLAAGEADTVDRAVSALERVVPEGGTSLWHGLEAMRAMAPRPDNLILLVDGLPTQGRDPPRRATVTGKRRRELFSQAVNGLSPDLPINVILFPMEGDPLAASAFWRLAVRSRGSFMSPAEDWP